MRKRLKKGDSNFIVIEAGSLQSKGHEALLGGVIPAGWQRFQKGRRGRNEKSYRCIVTTFIWTPIFGQGSDKRGPDKLLSRVGGVNEFEFYC